MSKDPSKLTEAEVRELRNKIYGPTSDNNWESCKKNWLTLENRRWLVDNQNKKKQNE